MSSILGLKGLSTQSSNTLIAAYGNDFINVTTGLGYGTPITSGQNVEFEIFLQSLFFQNYIDTPLTFDGTSWSRKHVGKVPLAKFIHRWQGRMYLGFVKINGVEYPSRSWFSDLSKNNTIQWGFETGTNLVTIAGNTLVSSANSGFKAFNIKRGDPFIIATGPNAGEYSVQSVSADQQLILTTAPLFSSTGDTFVAGGNFLDIDRDNGDFLTWIGENDSFFYSQLLFYKRDTLYRYDTQRLVKVQGAFGTTSGRSVVNLKELSLYFYGASGLDTGIYAYDNRESKKISSPIEQHIQGISPTMFNQVVGWKERGLARFYVGDINNTDYKLSVPNAVLTYDYFTKSWSVDPIADLIVCSTEFRQGNIKQAYFGTNTDSVMLTPTGSNFNGNPIPWKWTTHVIYPLGTTFVNEFTRIQITHENAAGINVSYKLHLAPFDSWDQFQGLGQLETEKTEFKIPFHLSQGSGIELMFTGDDTVKSTALIKKISIFYKKLTTVLQ